MVKKHKEKQKKKKQEENSEPQIKSLLIKPSKISWIVFFFTISMTIISLIPIVFPAIIVSNFTVVNDLEQLGISGKQVDVFETGILAVPLFITSAVVFGLAILYFKNKLPQYLSKAFQFVFDFEISRKLTIIIMIAILSIYVAASVTELAEEEPWEDFVNVKQRLENWSPDQIVGSFDLHVRYFLITSSMVLFGNYAIIPFLASIILLITVYFFTKQITHKRFAGIISMVILLQSNVFLIFDTAVAYTNFWILLYLLSLYLMYKAWPLSPVSYVLSIPAKALTIMFLPMSLYFLFRSSITKNKKIIIAGTLVVVIVSGAIYSNRANETGGLRQEGFMIEEFWIGFASFATQMRFDGMIIVFLIPLIVGLLLASQKNKHAESMMVMIAGMLLIPPILTGFTDQTNQPYRFVPIVTFFAVGVGILLSKSKKNTS